MKFNHISTALNSGLCLMFGVPSRGNVCTPRCTDIQVNTILLSCTRNKIPQHICVFMHI